MTARTPRLDIRAGDIVLVDGKKATVVRLLFGEGAGVVGAEVGIHADGASEVTEVGLHRIRVLTTVREGRA